MRPIEGDGTLAQARQDVRLDVVVPNRTVEIDEEHVTATRTPTAPKREMEEQTGEQVKFERHNDERRDYDEKQ